LDERPHGMPLQLFPPNKGPWLAFTAGTMEQGNVGIGWIERGRIQDARAGWHSDGFSCISGLNTIPDGNYRLRESRSVNSAWGTESGNSRGYTGREQIRWGNNRIKLGPVTDCKARRFDEAPGAITPAGRQGAGSYSIRVTTMGEWRRHYE